MAKCITANWSQIRLIIIIKVTRASLCKSLGHIGHPFLFDHSFTTFASFYTGCKKKSHWKENEIQRKMLFIWQKNFHNSSFISSRRQRVFQFSETITRKRNPAESRSNSWRTWLCTKSFFFHSQCLMTVTRYWFWRGSALPPRRLRGQRSILAKKHNVTIRNQCWMCLCQYCFRKQLKCHHQGQLQARQHVCLKWRETSLLHMLIINCFWFAYGQLFLFPGEIEKHLEV